MDMLDWARGPLLTTALLVFVVGVAWRLFALWRLPASAAGGAPARQPFDTADALQASHVAHGPAPGVSSQRHAGNR